MWQESCRRCRVAVASRGISQIECVPCPLQPHPRCSQHTGVVKKLLLVQVGGQPGVLAAVGGLGRLKMWTVAVFVFTRQVLARCRLSCPVSSRLVVRVLLWRGSCVPWGWLLPLWHTAQQAHLDSPGRCQLSSPSCPGAGDAAPCVPVYPRGGEQEIWCSTLGR